MSKSVFLKSYLQLSYLYLPYLIIAFLYDNWMLVQQVTSPSFQIIDPGLKLADEFIFRQQPAFYLERWLNPIAVDYFMAAYSMFFIYPFFYLIYLIQKNAYNLFQEILLAQNLAIIISLICFIIFPAKGPRVLLAEDFTIALSGIHFDFLKEMSGSPSFFHMQYDLWNLLERIKTDCMPSMHSGLCLLCLMYALKNKHLFKYRKTALYFWIIGVGSLIISTVYLRYHWVVDVIAGAVLAVIIYYLSGFIYKRFLQRNRVQVSIPWTPQQQVVR
jgi:membrane-associated phospholipid phosphatase